jgi:hypothetical protein
MFFINTKDKLGKTLHKNGNNTVPLKIPISLLGDKENIINNSSDGSTSFEVFAIIRLNGDYKYETSVLRNWVKEESWVTFKEDKIIRITESEAISCAKMHPSVVCYR